MSRDWYDDVEQHVDEMEEGRRPLPERWPAGMLDGAPPDAFDGMARELSYLTHPKTKTAPVRLQAHRLLYAELLLRKGDPEALRHLPGEAIKDLPDGASERSSAWRRAAERFQIKPGLPAWRRLLAVTPGATPVDRAQCVMERLLLRGFSFQTLLARLTRAGPVPELDPIAETGLVSQFEFGDRAHRTCVEERKRGWLELAVVAARARDHFCCVGMYGIELEMLDEEEYDDDDDDSAWAFALFQQIGEA
ncbi:MAG: hypothetical protein JRJ84_26185 [Deltaproteobacteria bacterium]|nr:hypothetical protein [Deltaproteobacteria bacterium]